MKVSGFPEREREAFDNISGSLVLFSLQGYENILS